MPGMSLKHKKQRKKILTFCVKAFHQSRMWVNLHFTLESGFRSKRQYIVFRFWQRTMFKLFLIRSERCFFFNVLYVPLQGRKTLERQHRILICHFVFSTKTDRISAIHIIEAVVLLLSKTSHLFV